MNILKWLWNDFSKNVIHDKRGIWPALAFLGNPAFWQGAGQMAGAAGGVLGGLLGKDDEVNPEDLLVYKELPGYKESDAARGEWWNRLQEWGKQPGYGAIAPDWEDIWSRAKNKLTQYYWGGTMDTGLAGKVKASAARRNVSQSPALENMLTAMGMQEAQDVKELAGTQAEKQAAFSETGRQNWLTSLMNLTQMKPSYVTGTGTTTPQYDLGNMITDVSGGIGDLFSQYSQQEYLTKQKQQEQDWMMKLFENYSGGSGGTTLGSNLGAAKSDSSDLASLYPNLFKTY